MGGNRKHGFLYGNNNARNGVGVMKPFYCDACQKTHSASVQRTGVQYIVGYEAVICDRMYYKLKDSQFESDRRENGIAELKRLKTSIGLSGSKGLKARIKFLVLAYSYRLVGQLKSYEIYDEHGLGEREFDTCVEMFDGDQVIHGLMLAASKDYWLKTSIRNEINAETFQRWQSIFNKIEQEKDISQPCLC